MLPVPPPFAKPLNKRQVRAKFFPDAARKVTQRLTALDALGVRKSDAVKAPPEISARMLALIDALVTDGVSPFAASLYALTGVWAPPLGALLEKFAFTRDERVQLLTQFVRPENHERYPVLDLSRQELTRIPQEIEVVHVEPTNLGSVRSPIPYREINLGYNPLARLGAPDFERLNRFEGIHLIALHRKTLPASIGRLTNAVMLNFSWSDLTSLPPELYRLKRLRALKLNWTSIGRLSLDIRRLGDLGLLELAETPLRETLAELDDDETPKTEVVKQATKLRAILRKMCCRIVG